MTRLPTPALDLWHEELRKGRRTPTTYDPLWRAACEEMNALEAPDPATAQGFLDRADRIVRDAMRAKRKGTA